MMSSRRFRGFARLKVVLLEAVDVGKPPATDRAAAEVYSFAMAAPSPLMHAGLITLGAVKKTPPQLAGITAGCLSVTPAATSVKSPVTSAAVGKVSVTEAAVNPGYTPRNFFHSCPAKKNNLPLR